MAWIRFPDRAGFWRCRNVPEFPEATWCVCYQQPNNPLQCWYYDELFQFLPIMGGKPAWAGEYQRLETRPPGVPQPEPEPEPEPDPPRPPVPAVDVGPAPMRVAAHAWVEALGEWFSGWWYSRDGSVWNDFGSGVGAKPKDMVIVDRSENDRNAVTTLESQGAKHA